MMNRIHKLIGESSANLGTHRLGARSRALGLLKGVCLLAESALEATRTQGMLPGLCTVYNMSHHTLQKLMVRMLFDEDFVEEVYAAPERALAGIDLTEAERGQLLDVDRRAWR